MSSLQELLREHPQLSTAQVSWLRLLVSDWQLFADLSFADVVLWVPSQSGWQAVAQVRPTTGPTVFVEDRVGSYANEIEAAGLAALVARPQWSGPEAGPVSFIPVVRDGELVAGLTQHFTPTQPSPLSSLEQHYVSCATALAQMIARGQFPLSGAVTGSRRGAPRVSDGLILLDQDAVVVYASPNGVSAYHRLGFEAELVGRSLAELTTPLLRGRAAEDEGLPLVLLGKAPFRADVEGAEATLSMRSLPLITSQGERCALLLVRDVTELRSRERELLSKDATIREIHHRVKNNLQTVAALLRLQARRVDDGAAGRALRQAERRVAAIAWVHETLSTGFDETVDFGEVASSGLSALAEVARPAGAIHTKYCGRFGRIRGEDATALSLILTELVQNAAEHGLAGRDGEITVTAERIQEAHPELDQLIVTVSDDGVGLPVGTATSDNGSGPQGLGGQIVRSLVGELRGTMEWTPRPGGGTSAVIRLRPRPLQ